MVLERASSRVVAGVSMAGKGGSVGVQRGVAWCYMCEEESPESFIQSLTLLGMPRSHRPVVGLGLRLWDGARVSGGARAGLVQAGKGRVDAGLQRAGPARSRYSTRAVIQTYQITPHLSTDDKSVCTKLGAPTSLLDIGRHNMHCVTR